MKRWVKAICMILTAAVTLSSASALTFAAEAADELPEKYDSRDFGYITPVKNQHSYGTCWAHGVLAASEASLIKNNGYPSDLDLSEFHLAYSAYHTLYDRLGLFRSQQTDRFLQTYMNDGGDSDRAAIAMACWNGPVTDSAHYRQFTSDKFEQYGLNQLDFASKELQYCMNAAQLTDYCIVQTADLPKMKECIMKYGAGTISLFSDPTFRDEEKGVWFYNEESFIKADGHLMAVVGWDNTIPAEQLSVNGYTPSRDGAFIVKNSWGENYGDQGYYYVPYEPYMLEGESFFFSFADAGTYTYQYAYDDSISNAEFFDTDHPETVTAGNIFTASSEDEILRAVSFFPSSDNLSYEVKVYSGLSADALSPEEGALAATISGKADRGYRTVSLPEPIELEKGDRFSVVVTLSSADGSKVLFDVSQNFPEESHRKRGESFLYMPSRGWYDICDNDFGLEGNPRIKAFTTSSSAPATQEPDDYDSYNGLTREQLLKNMKEEYARYETMSDTGYWNYNREDIAVIGRYYGIFNSIEEHSDMYTASEIFATTENFSYLLDHVRSLDPESLLVSMDLYATQILRWSQHPESDSWYEFKDKYDSIKKMAENQELTVETVPKMRDSLGESFMKLFADLVEAGYGVSFLQLYGDVDGDGKISVLDATEIQKILASVYEKSFCAAYNIDADGDHVDSILDALMIQKYLVKLIDHFPVYDNTFDIEDGYSPASSKEELKAYLAEAIEQRSSWEKVDFNIYTDYTRNFSHVIYEHAKEQLENANRLSNAVLLFYTRNLISQVRETPYE